MRNDSRGFFPLLVGVVRASCGECKILLYRSNLCEGRMGVVAFCLLERYFSVRGPSMVGYCLLGPRDVYWFVFNFYHKFLSNTVFVT